MPQCCVVPMCSNRKSGHRFPKDGKLLKKWLVAIRRDKFTPSRHSRVCNDHFAPEDFVLPKDSVSQNPKPYLQKGVVPSRFAWSANPSDTVLRRIQKTNERRSNIVTTAIQTKESDLVEETENNLVHPPDPLDISEEIQHTNEVDVGLTEVKNEVEIGTKDAEVQSALCTCGYGLGKKCKNRETVPQSSECTYHTSSYHNIKHLVGKADELKFYKGFENYNHFMSPKL